MAGPARWSNRPLLPLAERCPTSIKERGYEHYILYCCHCGRHMGGCKCLDVQRTAFGTYIPCQKCQLAGHSMFNRFR